MQNVNQLTTNLKEKLQSNTNNGCNVSLTSSLESKYSPKAIQAATAKVLILFAEYKEEYGGLFDYKEHRYTASKAREWAVELLESGINKEQYEYGSYHSVKRSKYPPERAYEFIELCRQNDPVSSYPDTQSAFDIACQNCGMRGQAERNWQHEVIHETATRIGWGKLANADYNYLKHFDSIYQQVISEHKAGATFVIPESHQIEHSHNPVKPDSPKSAEIDDFLNKFRRKEQQA